MSKLKFFLSVKNGIIEKSSKLANRYVKPEKTITENKTMSTFLREQENYVAGIDKNNIFSTYSYDDLPLSSNLYPDYIRRNSDKILSNVIDTDLPTIKILGTDKKIYYDNLFCNEIATKYLENGFDAKDVANILYKAKDYQNSSYVYDSFKLIESGYPLELVLKYMDDALLDAQVKYQPDFLKFVANFPGKKHFVITRNKLNKQEVLDTYAMKHFHILETTCKSDDEIKSVIQACHITDKKGNVQVSKYLFETALEILHKNKTWSNNDSKILEAMKSYEDQLDFTESYVTKGAFDKAMKLLAENKTPEEVIKKLNALKNKK